MGHYASEMHLDVKVPSRLDPRWREKAMLIINELTPSYIVARMHDQLMGLFVDWLLGED